MSEQRRFSRIPFDAESTLGFGERVIPAHLIDLSLKGALLELCGAAPPPLGSPAVLEVRLLGSAAAIRMEGEVVHLEDDRLGLRCRSIDLDSIAHLRRLIELNSGDPGRVERELSALI